MDDDREVLIRQVRARSEEHGAAMQAACDHGWFSVAVGILRQELDSMIRLVFLLAIEDRPRRAGLVQDAVSGVRWRNEDGRTISDDSMVRLVHRRLPDAHWVREVYDVGCGFIHLSRFHDWQARDPFRALSLPERRLIARYLGREHGGHRGFLLC